MYVLILGLLAASFMMFQVAVLRELRFQLSTVFTLTPFLFSSVIVFIGLGSIAARLIRTETRRILRWGVAILPVLVLPLFALTIFVPKAMIDHSTEAFTYTVGMKDTKDLYMNSIVLAFVAVAILGYGLVFFLQGLIFAAYFREGRERGILSRLYAVDLLASGVAAIAGGYLSFVLDPIHLAILAASLLLLNLWVVHRYLRIRIPVVLVMTAMVLGMIGTEVGWKPLSRMEAPDWLGKNLVYSSWSPYRRWDVMDDPDKFGVFTDGLLFHVYSHDKEDETHAWDPRRLPVLSIVQPDPKVRDILVIGAGTGADVRVLNDLVDRPLNVVAVELDEACLEIAKEFPWLWEHFRKAEIVIQEGRYYLENTEREFDLVLYAYIDPQSAISKVGLPDANFLYTDAGIRAAYSRVRDGGYLFITRVFLVEQARAIVERVFATLDAAGIPRSEARVFRGPQATGWGYYGNLASLHVVIHKGGEPPGFDVLIEDKWTEGGRPTTDLYPFSILTGHWFEELGGYVKRSALLVAILSVVGVALLLRVSTSVGHLSFFLLGIGSFLVECLVLYSSFLLIGNPSLSAACGVGFFLFWNGLGSLLSDRLERRRATFVAVPVIVLLYAVTAPWLNHLTIALPVGARTAIFAAHLAIPGVAVGAMFPMGLRIFRDRHVPSMFFIDLAGCALAPIIFWLTMSWFGVPWVGALATGAYAILAVIFLLRRR